MGLKEKIGAGLIAAATFLAVGGLFSHDPIPQNPSYHLFADERNFLAIPNFGNVVSNSLFLIVGGLGCFRILRRRDMRIENEIQSAYLLFFLAVGLIGIGSAYYHLSPSNDTLVWDRLPMSVAFMALFTVVIGEFVSVRLGKILLLPLVLAGIASVLYWHSTELSGQGDLRFYALVQFLPMVIIPIMLGCFRSRFSGAAAYGWLLMAYGLAKLCEHFDGEIYQALVFVSGHTLKHVAAAIGLCILLAAYQHRDFAGRDRPRRA
jgi:hypothetical protein